MKIICFGDSNTYGYDPRSYFGERYGSNERWVDILGELMECEILNEGENGREIPRREDELAQFAQLLENEQPVNLMIIMLGTNDLLRGNPADAVVKCMERFLNRIDFPMERILLIAPPIIKQGEWVSLESYIHDFEELSAAYKALAARLRVHFVEAEKWNIETAFDGVHFTPEGHRIFAQGVYRYLVKENEQCWKLE